MSISRPLPFAQVRSLTPVIVVAPVRVEPRRKRDAVVAVRHNRDANRLLVFAEDGVKTRLQNQVSPRLPLLDHLKHFPTVPALSSVLRMQPQRVVLV